MRFVYNFRCLFVEISLKKEIGCQQSVLERRRQEIHFRTLVPSLGDDDQTKTKKRQQNEEKRDQYKYDDGDDDDHMLHTRVRVLSFYHLNTFLTPFEKLLSLVFITTALVPSPPTDAKYVRNGSIVDLIVAPSGVNC